MLKIYSKESYPHCLFWFSCVLAMDSVIESRTHADIHHYWLGSSYMFAHLVERKVVVLLSEFGPT